MLFWQWKWMINVRYVEHRKPTIIGQKGVCQLRGGGIIRASLGLAKWD